MEINLHTSEVATVKIGKFINSALTILGYGLTNQAAKFGDIKVSFWGY